MPIVDLLWLAALSKDIDDAGTDDRHNLTINIDGVDVVDHNLKFGPHDIGRGQAGLRETGVLPTPFESLALTNSSIRWGIRGGDAWAPQDVLVFGRTQPSFEPSRTVALAMETDLALWVSSDRNEGHLTMPIRLVSSGSSATVIRKVLLLVYTFSGAVVTDSAIQLQITAGGNIVLDQQIGDTQQSDLEEYTANWYPLDAAVPFTRGDVVSNGSIRLRILGSDAWQPQKAFVFGLDTATGRPNEVVTLVAIPEWDLGLLSTDTSEGSPSVLLPVQSI